MLIDSHCHLDYLEAEDDLDEIVARARAAGVAGMVTICTRVSEFDRIRAIAERYPDVYCSVGVHPHEAEKEGRIPSARLVALAAHPKVVGIGETGLDYYYEHSPRAAQQDGFRAHIAAARKSALPLIVHSRDADDDTMDILEEEYGRGAFTGVIHCFTASRALADRALAIGFCISLSGIVTFKSAKDIQATAKDLPDDRLLVETDAPYLAPVPHRGKRNEPALVTHTADYLATLRGVSPATLAQQTTRNFHRLFSRTTPAETPTT